MTEQCGDTLSWLRVKDIDVLVGAAGGEERARWIHLHLHTSVSHLEATRSRQTQTCAWSAAAYLEQSSFVGGWAFQTLLQLPRLHVVNSENTKLNVSNPLTLPLKNAPLFLLTWRFGPGRRWRREPRSGPGPCRTALSSPPRGGAGRTSNHRLSGPKEQQGSAVQKRSPASAEPNRFNWTETKSSLRWSNITWKIRQEVNIRLALLELIRTQPGSKAPIL